MSALDRREVVARILAERGDTLVVTGLGSTTWDAAAAGDHPNNFYLWGGMGGAAMVGLGLANAQPGRRVLVITGDGEMLMGLAGLATIGVSGPSNLAVVVIDNERYGETGMQETHTAHGVDLAAVARAPVSPPRRRCGRWRRWTPGSRGSTASPARSSPRSRSGPARRPWPCRCATAPRSAPASARRCWAARRTSRDIAVSASPLTLTLSPRGRGDALAEPALTSPPPACGRGRGRVARARPR